LKIIENILKNKINMILGDQHRPLEESLEVEFKEFCLHEYEMSTEEIYEIVKKGKIKKNHFNQDIYKNIKHYFYKYIPKYTSAFINAGINGNLIFGVNDYGEITGIPFIGSKQELQVYIDNISIKHFLRGNQNVEIVCNVEELIPDLNFLDDISGKLLKEYYFNIKQKNLIIEKFKNDRLKWADNMNEYTCKLSLLLSSKKQEFEKYLNIYAPEHLNYIIKSNEMKNISHLKIDSTHYIYWLMQFKDSNILKIKNSKPQMPELPKICNGPKYLFKHLTNLRYHLIQNNKYIKYFIINIKISSKQIQHNLSYYDIDKKIWIEKIRKLHKDGPQCNSSE
jgi:hypothetical protein